MVHTAGLKSVNDSVSNAFTYYYVNVYGTINLLKKKNKWACKKIVFSSSATVYGIPTFLPFTEKHPIAPINPYGVSKFYAEEVIKGWCSEYVDNAAIALRFFNPVGAHPSGLIGKLKMLPQILCRLSLKLQLAKDVLEIYGNDYNTRDGSGERDFIHVMDIASITFILLLLNTIKSFEVYNLGTGKGTTVFELIHEFEVSTGKKINFVISPRREGDVASSWSNAQKQKMS